VQKVFIKKGPVVDKVSVTRLLSVRVGGRIKEDVGGEGRVFAVAAL
jgi:hypothetical protein